MADKSEIEWTDATWQPITGCSVVSPACTNCYAMRLAGTRLRNHPSRAGLTTMSKAGPVWTGEVRFNEEWLLDPLRWKRGRRIFVCAHADLFHENVPDEWIDKIFAVMALAPQHTFQVLTKRPARMREYLAPFDSRRADSLGKNVVALGYDGPLELLPWPLPNVWLGVTTEDQQRADERIPDLLATQAAVRFISAEPLLGPIDLTRVGTLASVRSAMPGVVERETRGRPASGNGSICGAQIDAVGSPGSSITFFQTPDHMGGFTAASPRQWPSLDWVIAGGESGPGARPMHPDWPRGLRDQCKAANVPFMFKQWGAWAPRRQAHQSDLVDARKSLILSSDGRQTSGLMAFSDDAWIVDRVDKSAAGRLLDGVEHNGFPEVHHG